MSGGRDGTWDLVCRAAPARSRADGRSAAFLGEEHGVPNEESGVIAQAFPAGHLRLLRRPAVDRVTTARVYGVMVTSPWLPRRP